MTDDRSDTSLDSWSAIDLREEAQTALRERRFEDVLALTVDAEAPDQTPDPAALGPRAIAYAGLGQRDKAYALIDRLAEITGGDPRAWVAKRMAARLLGDLPVLIDMQFVDLEQTFSQHTCRLLARNLAQAIDQGLVAPPPSAAIVDRLCRAGVTVNRLRAAGVLLSMMDRRDDAATLYANILRHHRDDVDVNILAEASIAFAGAKRPDEARKATSEAVNRTPVVQVAVRNPKGRLLVMADQSTPFFSNRNSFSAATAYGGGNYAAQIMFQHLDVTYGLFDAPRFVRIAREIGPDAIICNFSFRTGRPNDFLARVDSAIDKIGGVVINHPRQALSLTRHGNYQRLAARQDITMARTEPLSVDGTRIESLIDDIEQRFTYPVIVRPLGTQFGGGAQFIETRQALAERLRREAGNEIYVIQFLDLQRDWNNRPVAYRAVMIDGALYPAALFTGVDWTTHIPGGASRYRETVLAREDRFQQTMRDYMLDFETTIAAKDRQALLSAMIETGMDTVGADFGFTKEGLPVIFEMNASMLYQFTGLMGPQFPYFVDTDARIRDAMETMILRRIGAA